jgi:hypothetical protein
MDESTPCYEPGDVVGIFEVADRLGLRADSLAALRGKGGMPPERGTVGGRVPWWSWSTDIVPWAVDRGYMKLVDDGPGEDATVEVARGGS